MKNSTFHNFQFQMTGRAVQKNIYMLSTGKIYQLKPSIMLLQGCNITCNTCRLQYNKQTLTPTHHHHHQFPKQQLYAALKWKTRVFISVSVMQLVCTCAHICKPVGPCLYCENQFLNHKKRQKIIMYKKYFCKSNEVIRPQGYISIYEI